MNAYASIVRGTAALALVFVLPLSAQTRSPTPEFAAIRQELLTHVGADDVPGLAVAVLRGDSILWEEAFGWADREKRDRATPTTPFFVASVTKAITATGVMHLAERGQLNLDASANTYLGPARLHSPQWKAADATVRRLLSHTSGLTTFSRWCAAATDPRCDIDGEIANYGVLVWPPGEVFDYSNLGYGVLGRILSRASGEDLGSYLRTEIFQRLGMRNCALSVAGTSVGAFAAQYDQNTYARSEPDASGHPGATGLHCSVHDLVLFGRLHLEMGLTPASPLSPSDIEAMHTAQPATRGQYGLGWWIREQSGIRVVSAQGGTTDAYALLELVPSRKIALAIVANSYSQRVANLEKDLLSKLLPESTSNAPTQTPPSKPNPGPLAGQWAGSIDTPRGSIKIALHIDPGGGAQVRINDGEVLIATSTSVRPSHVYGEVPGRRGLPDAPSAGYVIQLDLALRGDELVGAATFAPPAGGAGDQLPHFVHLIR
jgi:CubicO group peptidase (beta-lactamase class C family)